LTAKHTVMFVSKLFDIIVINFVRIHADVDVIECVLDL